MVLEEDDYAVRIGDRECRITSMSATQLVCKPLFDDDDMEPFKTGTQVTVSVSFIALICAL